jgi:hypothetical protein
MKHQEAVYSRGWTGICARLNERCSTAKRGPGTKGGRFHGSSVTPRGGPRRVGPCACACARPARRRGRARRPTSTGARFTHAMEHRRPRRPADNLLTCRLRVSRFAGTFKTSSTLSATAACVRPIPRTGCTAWRRPGGPYRYRYAGEDDGPSIENSSGRLSGRLGNYV